MKLKIFLALVVNLVFLNYSYSQEREERTILEYSLKIETNTVNFTGKEVMEMAMNGNIPGPTLQFIEVEQALIHVIYKMEVKTSMHWHAMLLPNYLGEVAYLPTPPIKSGANFNYTSPIKRMFQ